MQPENQPCLSCGKAVSATARFCSFCGAPVARPDASAPHHSGEHRQITVMFCDLVGSTALSNQLDSEDLRDLLRTYQSICADAIEARDGTIAQYLGDGVLAYFGYPNASENAAIHAADAALDIVSKVEEAGAGLMRRHGADFATRIALHTGRVLIGEMGAGHTRDHHAVTGAVPNLAARLEQYAPRNGAVISAQTKALVSGAFRIETMGRFEMKGFADPVEVFQVTGRHHVMPILPPRDAPLVGREHELSILSKGWARAGEGANVRMSVIAEPGTGKSALAAAFLSADNIGRDRIIELSGILSDRNTPFACLRQTIRRWTALGQMRNGTLPQQQIARWFGKDDIAGSPYAETFHRLWNGEVEHGPEGRASVFAACRARLASLPKPMLIIVEDAHWLDPSTDEMLDRIESGATGLMVLKLSRPGFESGAAQDEEVITLSKLDFDACRRLTESVAGGPVEAGLARLIADVSDGLPLYIEEFTKSLIEASLIRRERGVFRSANLHTAVATPASLLDLITVRLDALGEAKALAQVCAVLGRSFSRDGLAAVSGESAGRLDAMIERLTDAGILTREWSGLLTFRHALFQTAAYESLLKTTRQQWHSRFLDWLHERPNRLAATLPETVAYHLEACGRNREAVEHYMQAGLSAERASASLEAAVHFRKCCDLLADVPQEEDLGALPLRAQVLLAGALLSARGPGASETRAAYETAIRLAENLPESEWHFAAYWGWWRVSENFATMAQRARRLLEKSESMQGLEFKLQAKHCVWANAFQMGEFNTSIASARDGLAIYDEGGFDRIGTLYGGHDCKVCALGEIGLASWLQGAGDGAQVHVDAAIAHAERLDHLGSLLHALDIAVMLHHYRRDSAAVKPVAERLIRLAVGNDLEDYRAKGEIFAGWVEIEAGRIDDGLARVDSGFRTLSEIGTPEDFPVYQCIRAAAMNRLGEPGRALAALADGRAIIAAEGVNYWGAEIARHEAEVEMTRSNSDRTFITERLAEARRVARTQEAPALELRAYLSHLEWLRSTGEPPAEPMDALRTILGRFPPEASGRDLAEAEAALSVAASG